MSTTPKKREGPVNGSRGATLVEVLVAVGIVVMALGTVGPTVFQVLALERGWRDDVGATRALRHADSWFSRDALNAESTDLTDGGPPVSSVTLSWEDVSGGPLSVVYTLSSNRLLRVSGADTTLLASDVVSAAFSLSGQMLNLTVEVQGRPGVTETASLDTYLRRLA